MSLLVGYPEGGAKISGNSAKTAYQLERSAIGANMECRLKVNSPSYFV